MIDTPIKQTFFCQICRKYITIERKAEKPLGAAKSMRDKCLSCAKGALNRTIKVKLTRKVVSEIDMNHLVKYVRNNGG